MKKTTLKLSEDGEHPLADTEHVRETLNLINYSSRKTRKIMGSLERMALFEDIKDGHGQVKRKKSQRSFKSSAFEQVLLEMRDKYEEVDRTTELAIHALEKYLGGAADPSDPESEGYELDPKTFAMLARRVEYADASRSKYLDNMRRGIETVQGDAHRNAVNYGKIIAEIGKQAHAANMHRDKMDLGWAKVEREVGMSREEIEKKLYEVEPEDDEDDED